MAVKTYASNDKTQLSEHFNVQEFRCKCGKSHSILIDSDLISKLEQVFDKLNCSKIIVNSGYRCPEHDKAVGGTSTGQHTKGTAADVVCYDQSGNPISSKLVSCTAQDLGFGGIANITSSYTSTHLDVRTGSKWYGDEVHGTNTVTNDFYSYYNISKSGNFENDSTVFGIDVSRHQGNINWSHVKADGVKFAIIRAGFGKVVPKQKDEQFENNYAGCKSNGIPCGAYWYSYAMSADEAREEAAACLEVLKGKTFEYPIYFDLEETTQFALGKKVCSDMVQAFCDTLEKAGYYAGLYCSTYYLTSYITESVRSRYAIWVAQYNKSCTYSGDYGIWQHSVAGHPDYDVFGKGSVYGISGQCDLDYCYVDYPTAIKKAGLNGFSKKEATTSQPSEKQEDNTLEQILQHVKSIDEKMK